MSELAGAAENDRAATRAATPATLLPLDARARGDHAYLERDDVCWALAEYHPGSYRGGFVNQLIANFKCAPSMAKTHPQRAYYKRRAMAIIAAWLHDHCPRAFVESATWVPIPSSKAIGDDDYDARLQETLALAFRGYDLDVRLMLRLSASVPADHEAQRRLGAQRLSSLLEVDGSALHAKPLRERLILFDDLLTSGKHFKCAQRRLRELLPESAICGCFIARRVITSRWR